MWLGSADSGVNNMLVFNYYLFIHFWNESILIGFVYTLQFRSSRSGRLLFVLNKDCIKLIKMTVKTFSFIVTKNSKRQITSVLLNVPFIKEKNAS